MEHRMMTILPTTKRLELSPFLRSHARFRPHFIGAAGFAVCLLLFLLLNTGAMQGYEIKDGDMIVVNDGNAALINIEPKTGGESLLESSTEAGEKGVVYHGIHDSLPPRMETLLPFSTTCKISMGMSRSV